VLFNVTGGPNLGLFEIDEAAEIIKEMADPEANIIFGTVIDERMGEDLQITVIATGFDAARKTALYGTLAEEEGIGGGVQAGLENRDFMRELERQRTAAGDQDDSSSQQSEARQAVAVPVSTGEPVAAGGSSEAEDLDIPAFLRRSR
jgi:cell division protein FtsZ